jgi:hypothetical protein
MRVYTGVSTGHGECSLCSFMFIRLSSYLKLLKNSYLYEKAKRTLLIKSKATVFTVTCLILTLRLLG